MIGRGCSTRRRPRRRSPVPVPLPDPALFPRNLSVTEIEILVRDPYSIFARHILKLDALDALAVAPGAADRGTIIHEVLGEFAQAYPRELPAHAHEDLLGRGAKEFARIAEAFPGALRGMVAALRASGDRVPALGNAPPARHSRRLRGMLGRASHPACRRHRVHPARARGSDRASPRRRFHHRRFQDRAAARHPRGLCGVFAAAHP